MKRHSLSKHELHEELKEEAIAEFLGEQDEFHHRIHQEANHHYKKFLFFFSAILLLSLFTSFAVLAPVNSVIQGQLRSSTINHNVVLFGDYSLYFSKSVADTLPSLYEQNQIVGSVETAVCLIGSKVSSKSYVVEDIYYPEIYKQSFGHVSFSSCPPESIVMLHTHPYKSCLASDTDLNTHAKLKELNDDLLMIIMCEGMRFSVYS